MALPTASDNAFPSLLVTEGSAPSSPAAGKQRVFIDTSDHLLKVKNSSGTVTTVGSGVGGSVATDAIWDAAGDLVQGTGADTAAKLTAGSTSQVLTSAGAAAANSWKYPPGYQFVYTAFSAPVTVSGTTEGGANTVVTSGAVTYDGSTVVQVEFYAPRLQAGAASGTVVLDLYLDSTIQGRIGIFTANNGTGTNAVPCFVKSSQLTPSNASHTFTVKAWRGTVNGEVTAGAGGTGDYVNGYIRVVKV